MRSFRLRALPSVFILATGMAQASEQSSGHEDAHGHGHGHEGEIEEVVVQATRMGRSVDDEPVRVEVIVGEEIQEKLLMRPGNIAMLVNETPGVRVQVTSPALGSANIRMQGMRGRYTQLLSDGLPLYGGQVPSLGLLQIPPTDLGQVEIIKGAASALYGPSALGGVINLGSKQLGEERETEFLFNLTTRDGQDLTAYTSTPVNDNWGYSVVAGINRQSEQDLDDDGWIDMPEYERATIRPRLFWEGNSGATAYFTMGAATEDRVGGTLPGATVPDGQPFPQTQDTTRFDAGLLTTMPISDSLTWQVRAAGMTQDDKHRYGDSFEPDNHATLFIETTISAVTEQTTWLAGLVYQSDKFDSDAFPVFDYRHRVPGAFVQLEHDVSERLTLAGSARWDDHNEYGAHLSPRLSALYRTGDWSWRASLGSGFHAPTPFVEAIENAGLSRLEPLTGLRAETADTASLDVGGPLGPLEANLTLFTSRIRHAVQLETINPNPVGDEKGVRLVNVNGNTRTSGAELLLRYRWQDISVTGSYVYIDASEPDIKNGGRREVPLTPRHNAGLVAMWEQHGRGRLGLEIYYTGIQPLEDNPYRSEGRSYVHVGLLGEWIVGKFGFFLNLENILNVRQTRWDPLVLPARAASGSWTVDAWAPNEGFIANGGVRIRF